jgi:hypothetical protein
LTAADGLLCVELVRVYDVALCHFIYECCKPDLARLLNSERIKALNSATPTEFKWEQHEAALLNQLKDTAESDDLLAFFLLAREDGLHVQLWISERRAGRVLLEKDGAKLKEATWLSHALHFITADERTLLKVPADRDQSAHGMGTGREMKHLESPPSGADPSSFKRFRHSIVTNPLGKRALRLSRLSNADDASKVPSSSSSEKGQSKHISKDHKKKPVDEKEGFSANQKAGNSKNSSSGKKVNSQSSPSSMSPDSEAVLPRKDGELDMERHNGWNAGGLHRRIWDRITASPPQCARCGSSDHERSACKETALPWEEDLNKGTPFWQANFHRPQQRPQLTSFPSLSAVLQSRSLRALCGIIGPDGPITVAVDTCSDVNARLTTVGIKHRDCVPVSVDGLAGAAAFSVLCDLPIICTDGSIRLLQCFAVSLADLPPSCDALLGIPAIMELGVSVGKLLHSDAPELLISAPTAEAFKAPHVRNPFSQALALLMALCVFVATGFLHFFDTQCPATAALLPGSTGGHPLFDSLPSVSFDDVVLETCPANLFCALELWTPSSKLPHPSENPGPFVQCVHSVRLRGRQGITRHCYCRSSIFRLFLS